MKCTLHMVETLDLQMQLGGCCSLCLERMDVSIPWSRRLCCEKATERPLKGEKKDLPVHQTSQASSGSLAAAIGRPNHRNYLEPRIQRQRTGKHKMLQVRSELPLAIERICASNGTDGKTPTHAPTRYIPVLPNPQIPKSPNQRHLKVKDVKDKSISALQLTLTPSSGIASIALDVSNPKQRNKGHMSHMLGSHASSASPAKVTSWQSPASTALKEASQTRSTRRTDKRIVDRKAKRCQKQRYAKINKIMNLMNLMCFG